MSYRRKQFEKAKRKPTLKVIKPRGFHKPMVEPNKRREFHNNYIQEEDE